MTTVVLDLPDKVYERAQHLAQARQQAVNELLAEVLDDALALASADEEFIDLSEPDEAVERERAAYLKMHAWLWQNYPNQHVAIYGGRLIDHDVDGALLSQRIDEQYPNEFVLIRQVEIEPERVLVFRSPRFSFAE